VRMLSSYSDCIVIRHRYEGAARFAAELSSKPIINAGDGRHEHPTQAILDLYMVRKSFGSFGKLAYGFIGDLRYARTVNSLLYLLTKFRPRVVYLISPQQLKARPDVLESLNYRYEEVESASEVAGEIDVLYVTRVQKERFLDELEYKKAKGSYVIDQKLVDELKDSAIILHPLPRIDEIDRDIDKSKKVKYFEEVKNGIAVREAVFWKMLSE
jgi:aspartate carbamoyltransferase catalytic subunit